MQHIVQHRSPLHCNSQTSNSLHCTAEVHYTATIMYIVQQCLGCHQQYLKVTQLLVINVIFGTPYTSQYCQYRELYCKPLHYRADQLYSLAEGDPHHLPQGPISSLCWSLVYQLIPWFVWSEVFWCASCRHGIPLNNQCNWWLV